MTTQAPLRVALAQVRCRWDFVDQSGRPHECREFVGPSFVVDPKGRVVTRATGGP